MTPSMRLPATITGLRGSRSASAPPTGESRPIGRNAPAATRTAQLAWPVREITSAPTATVCIQVPMLETRLAVHSTAKFRWRSGRSATAALNRIRRMQNVWPPRANDRPWLPGYDPAVQAEPTADPGYKWIALSNTTIGVLMASLNSSILLIALPDIFPGIRLDPLPPGNTSYLLWMLMGYLLVTAVLVVSFGRIGDMYGRVRMYNLGFAVFTLFSILLSVTWLTGAAAACG